MRRNTGPTDEVRAIVYERDKGRCALCEGYASAVHWHHRRPRGMGGSRDPQTNSPANLILLHPDCHSWVESRREEALEQGLLVPQGRNPAEWAIDHAVHGICYLLDDGTWEPVLGPDEPQSEVA